MAIPDDALTRLYDLIHSLPPGLQEHLHRVRDVAMDLASRHGVDAAKVELAALGHDLLRAESDERLMAQARAVGLPVHPVEERVPILLHGPLAAEKLRRQCGVTDPEVLEAVRWHSTSCAGMGRVGLVVFLADKLDPHKAEGNPERRALVEVAMHDLEEAALQYLTAEMQVLLQHGNLVHPASVEARNYLLLKAAAPRR